MILHPVFIKTEARISVWKLQERIQCEHWGGNAEVSRNIRIVDNSQNLPESGVVQKPHVFKETWNTRFQARRCAATPALNPLTLPLPVPRPTAHFYPQTPPCSVPTPASKLVETRKANSYKSLHLQPVYIHPSCSRSNLTHNTHTSRRPRTQ